MSLSDDEEGVFLRDLAKTKQALHHAESIRDQRGLVLEAIAAELGVPPHEWGTMVETVKQWKREREAPTLTREVSALIDPFAPDLDAKSNGGPSCVTRPPNT